MMLRGLGHRPDPQDSRDHVYGGGYRARGALPSEQTRLTQFCPPTTDQGQEGACVGHALAAATTIEVRAHKDPNAEPVSPHYVYALARRLETGPPPAELVDDGSGPRFACAALQKWGGCPSRVWPSDASTLNKDPDLTSFLAAAKHRIAAYYAVVPAPGVNRSTAVAEVLAEGHPVCFALAVADKFDTWWGQSLGASLPARAASAPVRGMHYVTIVGYRFLGGELEFLTLNSWGTGWGENGYAWLTQGWVDDIASRDFRFATTGVL